MKFTLKSTDKNQALVAVQCAAHTRCANCLPGGHGHLLFTSKATKARRKMDVTKAVLVPSSELETSFVVGEGW